MAETYQSWALCSKRPNMPWPFVHYDSWIINPIVEEFLISWLTSATVLSTALKVNVYDAAKLWLNLDSLNLKRTATCDDVQQNNFILLSYQNHTPKFETVGKTEHTTETGLNNPKKYIKNIKQILENYLLRTSRNAARFDFLSLIALNEIKSNRADFNEVVRNNQNNPNAGARYSTVEICS